MLSLIMTLGTSQKGTTAGPVQRLHVSMRTKSGNLLTMTRSQPDLQDTLWDTLFGHEAHALKLASDLPQTQLTMIYKKA